MKESLIKEIQCYLDSQDNIFNFGLVSFTIYIDDIKFLLFEGSVFITHNNINIGEFSCGKGKAPKKEYYIPEWIKMLRPIADKIKEINTNIMEDNYICKRCGNNRCNTSEKSCWKCGEQIDTFIAQLIRPSSKVKFARYKTIFNV